jgi:short-chain Z-isoprenyl diphosphate synthase
VTTSTPPTHLGLVPDGNRRYAKKAGISKRDGYLAGAARAVEVIAWCREAGIRHVSAFGVSQENIARRPSDELCWLHEALVQFCEAAQTLPDVALHLFGEPTGLPDGVPGRDALIALQRALPPADAPLVVHVGANYSSGAEVAALLRAVETHGVTEVARAPGDFLLSAGVPPLDLVLRTGGQQRLSGFLPFQAAYAELWFTGTLWAELGRDEFLTALDWYARQERRLGE